MHHTQFYGMHPWLVKELAAVFGKLFWIVWKDLAVNRVPEGWRKASVFPILKADKKIEGNKTVPLMSGEVMEQIVLEAISKMNKKVISSGQNGLTEGKPAWQLDCLLQCWALDGWLSGWGESSGGC